jgi:hypothetical protein
MALATTMYHTEKNPLKKLQRQGGETVGAVRNGRQRKLHKAFLRYHDAENWPLLREALKEMGRADLIGNGKKQLVPAWQPAGTGATAQRASGRGQPAKTTQIQKASPGARAGLRPGRPAGKPPTPRARPVSRKP